METVNNKYKVLFVCLGNICRSPAAQGIFEHYVREGGMQDKFVVDSAGTYSGHRGELPDRRMRTAAMYRGYALTHQSRQVKSIDLIDFDMNGGYGTEPVYTRYGSAVGANDPIRHGYVFDGWELVSYDGRTPTAEEASKYAISTGYSS